MLTCAKLNFSDIKIIKGTIGDHRFDFKLDLVLTWGIEVLIDL
jgi:hypothetical protein